MTMVTPKRQRPAGGGWLSLMNPATGELTGRVKAHTVKGAAQAVTRARQAQPAWGSLPAAARARVLGRLRDAIVERADEIAETDHQETGKLLVEAKIPILSVLDFCNYYARLAMKLEEGRPVGSGPLLGRFSRIEYRPAGVAAVISPWNYPFFLAMAQIIPALAAGNAVVHKPSEHSARVGLLIGELGRQAGLPDGVLEVVIGDGRVGSAIIDARVDVISFTGAPRTGRLVMKAAAEHLTPVILELGGKDAAIVCDDADFERAANGVAWGAFTNAGQTCIAIKRAIVAEPLYDAFVDCLARRAQRLAAEPHHLSALTLESEIQRIEAQVSASVAEGARLVAGGLRLPGPGVFYAPTVLADCTPSMKAVREETFGPLLTILRARDDAEAVTLANTSDFGLSGSIWTEDPDRGARLARQLCTGGVAINDVILQAANPRLPFGGVKYSGVGRAFGEQGFLQYCNVQAVMTNLLTTKRDPHWYPYTSAVAAVADRIAGIYHGSWWEKLRRLVG